MLVEANDQLLLEQSFSPDTVGDRTEEEGIYGFSILVPTDLPIRTAQVLNHNGEILFSQQTSNHTPTHQTARSFSDLEQTSQKQPSSQHGPIL